MGEGTLRCALPERDTSRRRHLPRRRPDQGAPGPRQAGRADPGHHRHEEGEDHECASDSAMPMSPDGAARLRRAEGPDRGGEHLGYSPPSVRVVRPFELSPDASRRAAARRSRAGGRHRRRPRAAGTVAGQAPTRYSCVAARTVRKAPADARTKAVSAGRVAASHETRREGRLDILRSRAVRVRTRSSPAPTRVSAIPKP
jgi:hypothetical protein